MEFIALDIKVGHAGVADLDTPRIKSRVEFATYRQSGLCRGCGNEFDDRHAAGEGLAAPVLCDVTEQPMLDLVPF